MTKEIYYILALLAGLAVAIQTGVNSQLNQATNNPTVTALISFLVGTVALFIYVLILNHNTIPSPHDLLKIPWYRFVGGLMGAFYISSVVIIAPKIGAANTLGFIVAGQLIFAVIFDHFGWIGFPVKTINFGRIIGVILMIAGVYLIRKF